MPCTIPNLAAGASVTITVSATINAAGAFDNSTTVTASEFDPNPANNTDGTGNGGIATSVVISVDLSISKTSSAPTLSVGQTFDYIIVVHNNGPGTATGVVVTDTLPAVFNPVLTSTSQGSCIGTTSVTCNIGTMLNGANVTITLRGTVQSAGSLSNTATVSAVESETNNANNSSTAVPVVGQLLTSSIPTLSELSLGLLALLLAMTGALTMRSRP